MSFIVSIEKLPPLHFSCLMVWVCFTVVDLMQPVGASILIYKFDCINYYHVVLINLQYNIFRAQPIQLI